MKRYGLATLIAIITLACAEEETPVRPPATPDYRKLSQQYRQELEDERRRSSLQRAYIEEVTKTIDAVDERLATVDALVKDPIWQRTEPGTPSASTSRAQLLARLDDMQTHLAADAMMLDQLKARNATYDGKIATLENSLSRLRSAVGKKNKEITVLRASVRDLRKQVAQLQTAREDDQQKIQDTETRLVSAGTELQKASDQLHTVYYVVGRTDVLVADGVLLAQRRRFRRPLISLSETLVPRTLTSADRRTLTEIPVPGVESRVRFFPEKPPQGSCQFIAISAKESRLLIKDSEAFWRFGFLVIAVE
ncbi:MAG TPA: hypothetical protein VGF28_13260 [Thermoanaerobaculia bacterium]|jgi:predicted  nucleic acid-binding Zn-ribbon protein